MADKQVFVFIGCWKEIYSVYKNAKKSRKKFLHYLFLNQKQKKKHTKAKKYKQLGKSLVLNKKVKTFKTSKKSS